MKKMVLMIGLAMNMLIASAQAPVQWSLKVALGMSNLMGGKLEAPKVQLAYQGGVVLDCLLGKEWSLQTGLSFVTKGTRHTIVREDEISAQAQVNAFYLELPLMAVFRFPVTSQINVAVSAGPYGAWGVGGKTKTLDYRTSSSHGSDWGSHAAIEMDTFGREIALRRFDYGLGGTLMVEYHRYSFGGEVRFGLGKLQKELGAKNCTVFLFWGYKF